MIFTVASRFAGPLLTIICWGGLYQLCRELAVRGKVAHDWRVSWLMATLWWGALLTLIVELSGWLHALSAPVISGAWLVATAVVWGTAGYCAWKRGAFARDCVHSLLHRQRQRWPWDAAVTLGAAVLLILAIGAVALLTPTTNVDSLTYHMARVLVWIQQHSVAPFATTNPRQIEFGPWSSYAITVLYLLYGGDRFANLVQWFAMLSSVIAVTYLAQILFDGSIGPKILTVAKSDTHRRIAALTALVLVTLPIGIAEAISTQNDYIVAYWSIVVYVFGLLLFYAPTNRWYMLGIGLALSLGMLTKSTAAIYCAPLLLVLGFWLLIRHRRSVLPFTAAIVGLLLILNLPQMTRNYQVFGSPLSSKFVNTITVNETFTASGTLSNVIRNLTLHTPSGFDLVTNYLDDWLLFLHQATGRTINDKDITFQYTPFYVQALILQNDSTGSGFYQLLLVVSSIVVCLFSRKKHDIRMLFYLLLIFASVLLFAGYLRWQPWHSRLHIAYFVALAPFVGVTIGSRIRGLAMMLIVVPLFLLGVYCIFNNPMRPLSHTHPFLQQPREQQYFAVDPALYKPMREIAGLVAQTKCQDVGLISTYGTWEYPLRLLLQNQGFTGELHQVFVENETAKLGVDMPPVCAIISFVPDFPVDAQSTFPQIVSAPPLILYLTDASRAVLDPILGKVDPTKIQIVTIANPYGIQEQDGQKFFWMGNGPTLIRVRVPHTGDLVLNAEMFVGPSLPNVPTRRILVTTPDGYRKEEIIKNGQGSIVVPLTSVDTTITLLPLDKPTLSKLPNGDTRQLLLGMKNWQVELR